MSFATLLTIASLVVALAVLIGVHRRFTPAAAGLGPYTLLSIGALPLLFQLGASGVPSTAAGLVSILAVLGALSIRVRCTLWGIPARFVPDPGPSNSDLARSLATLRQQVDTQALAHAALHAEVTTMREALAAFAVEQEHQNRATLMAALTEVIADFNTRINGQFHEHLAQLSDVVGKNVNLQDRHRAQQAEMMHHARRNAEQMSQTTQAFGELVACGAEIAAIGQQIGQSMALLGPRQDAIDSALAAIAQDLAQANEAAAHLQTRAEADLEELTQRHKRAIDALGQRVGQHANDIGMAVQRSSEQTRSQFSDAAGKGQQQVAAMNKELGEALNKGLASLAKQLTAISTKLSSDLGPMAQQIRRVAEQSRIGK